MNVNILNPSDVDLFFRYLSGRILKLVKAEKTLFICIPNGQIRFEEAIIEQLLGKTNPEG